jgi:hypothetical protein
MRALAPAAALLLVAASFGACSSTEPVAPAAVVDAGADVAPDRVHPPEDDDAGELPPPTGPALLSETGLYADFPSRTLAPDLFTWVPRYEFWADGAAKSRYLYLPPGTKIDTSRIDDFVFPVGTKAFKEFRVAGRLVETRLLMKVRDAGRKNSWFQVAYVWKADGSDAVATPLGVKDPSHVVPSQADCVSCHGGVSDVLVGVSAIQLADPKGDALAALAAAGRLTTAPPAGIDVPGSGVVQDALGYLHGNCGHCHNDEEPKLATQSRLRLRLLVGQTTPEQTGAYTTTVGTVMKHELEGGVTDVVVKGEPARSGLFVRMGRRDAYGMPPAGTQQVDPAGLATIEQWITGWP